MVILWTVVKGSTSHSVDSTNWMRFFILVGRRSRNGCDEMRCVLWENIQIYVGAFGRDNKIRGI